MNNVGLNVGANNQNYQMSFKAKEEIAIRKALQKLKIKCPYIGKKVKPKEATIEHIQTAADKMEAEYNQYEQYIRKAVENGDIDADHATTLLVNKYSALCTKGNTLVEAANRAHRQAYLDKLKRTDPELYKYILRRDAEAEIAQMTAWQIAKKLSKTYLKNHKTARYVI